MDGDIELNIVAIIVAAIAAMGLGFSYYSPLLLGNPWMKQMGYTKEALKKMQKKMGALYGLSFVALLITSFILSFLVEVLYPFYGTVPVLAGMYTAFWMWLGFVFPVQLTDTIFGSKKWKLLAINTGYQLAALLTMGIILSLM